jgi:hypothetical protein
MTSLEVKNRLTSLDGIQAITSKKGDAMKDKL